MKIYKNKATKYHPSIEVNSDEKTWNNLELTQSPTKNNRYIELKHNETKTVRRRLMLGNIYEKIQLELEASY